MANRLAAVLAVAVLGGCSGASDGGSSTDASTAAQGVETGAAVAEVLRFSAPIVGGGELDGSTLAGRPVAFWFWAPT